jgi:serine/threonine protein phosphatase PrpC
MPQGLCFGVFDGHGGCNCAHRASETFPGLFVDELGEPGATPQDAFLKAFEKLHNATKDMHEGTTASVVFIPLSADMVHVAVLGDSPVIVKRADGSIWIAPEHNVRTNNAEAEAAMARGGKVIGGYLVAHWDGPGLQIARALGDKVLDRVLSRVPEISAQALGVGSFVLVCTDGALDPGHENTEAAAESVVELIQSGGDAQAIVDRALGIPTGDNVSALLVRVESAQNETRFAEPV